MLVPGPILISLRHTCSLAATYIRSHSVPSEPKLALAKVKPMTCCDILCDRVPLFFASLRRLSSHWLEPRVCRLFAFEAVGPWARVYVSPASPGLFCPPHKWVPLARVPPAPPVVRRCPGSWWAFVVDGQCPQQGFGFAVDGPIWEFLQDRHLA